MPTPPPPSNSTNPTLSLNPTPPIYVLPTHLDLDTLHSIEDTLLAHNARLTYDVAEAGLVLGKVGQKKRASLELRGRGVWTEDLGVDLRDEQRGGKRKREEVEVEEGLNTETEGQGEDGPGHKTDHHLKRPGNIPLSGPRPDIEVIKLDWLYQSLETGDLLPTAPFTVYQGRKIKNPNPNSTPKPPPKHPRIPANQQKKPPPTLHHQTTTSSSSQDSTPLPPPPPWVQSQIPLASHRSAPLHPPNEPFLTQLERIRRVRELTLDEIGVRAYSTSIAAIAAYPYQLRRASQVLELPGCDAKIAALFEEFISSPSGEVSAAKILSTDSELKALDQFAGIWGVGPKTAREWYVSRGWRDIDDIIEKGWGSLSRHQQIGLKYHDEFMQGVSRAEVEAVAGVVARHAGIVRPGCGGVECIPVGGHRRGKEVTGDVDLILTHRDEEVTMGLVEDVVASLEAEGWVTHTLTLDASASRRGQETVPFRADGGTTRHRHFDSLDKALVVWQDPGGGSPGSTDGVKSKKRNPNRHLRVDIIISPWRTVGCAVLGWTGDTTFQRDLRRWAKESRGWRFDSSGVRERSGGRVVDLEAAGRTWEERERLVMEGLGVGWRGAGERCSR